MPRLLYLFLAAAFLVPACSYAPVAKVYPLTDIDRRLPTEYVEVYLHPDSLTRPYRGIAVLKVVSSERLHQPKTDEANKYLAILKQKAQEIGADAIVIVGEHDPYIFGVDERERAAHIAKKGELPYAPRSTRTIYAKAVVYIQ